jgi:hypothetical protein
MTWKHLQLVLLSLSLDGGIVRGQVVAQFPDTAWRERARRALRREGGEARRKLIAAISPGGLEGAGMVCGPCDPVLRGRLCPELLSGMHQCITGTSSPFRYE